MSWFYEHFLNSNIEILLIKVRKKEWITSGLRYENMEIISGIHVYTA